MANTERQLPLLMIVRRSFPARSLPLTDDLKDLKMMGRPERPAPIAPIAPVIIDATRSLEKRKPYITLIKDKLFRIFPGLYIPKDGN